MLDSAVFFLEVVKHQSISLASKSRGISTSTGSRWIQELEQELNTTLLVRTTRSLTLTDSGKSFFDDFSQISERIDKAFRAVKTSDKQMKGCIKIASTPLYSHYFLSQIVGEFLSLHPEVTFKIIETAAIKEHVQDVDFSIKAMATYKGHLEQDSLLVKRLLLRYPLITVCSPQYIKKNGQPTKPHQLIHHNCLYTSTLVGGNHWQFGFDDEVTTIKISQSVEIESSEFIKSVAVNGGGIAYLPLPLVTTELDSGKLIALLQPYTRSEFEFSLYYQPRYKMPLRVREFKDYLIKRTKELKTDVFSV